MPLGPAPVMRSPSVLSRRASMARSSVPISGRGSQVLSISIRRPSAQTVYSPMLACDRAPTERNGSSRAGMGRITAFGSRVASRATTATTS